MSWSPFWSVTSGDGAPAWSLFTLAPAGLAFVINSKILGIEDWLIGVIISHVLLLKKFVIVNYHLNCHIFNFHRFFEAFVVSI